MKSFLIGYRHPSVKMYKPKVNRLRQASLFLLMAGDVIVPMTFGAGFGITKLVMKVKPLFLYK